MPKQTFFNLEADKRQQILDSAIDLFGTMPFKKVSIDKIVDHAGIPKGSFYQYFDNKEDLYKYLFVTISDEKRQYLQDAFIAIKQLPFSECIRQLYYSGMIHDEKTHGNLKDQFLLNCRKELRDEIVSVMSKESVALFEDILTYYKGQGQIKKELNVTMAAQMLTTLSIYIGKSLADQGANHEAIMKTIDEMIVIMEGGIV